jgi:AcrR family transcriptional regulator
MLAPGADNMLTPNTIDRDSLRRRAIITAARECFLQVGYAKASLDDIAQQAGIPRPLIYQRFPSKEAVLAAVFTDLFRHRYPAALEVVQKRTSRHRRLMRLYEIMLLEPWDLMMGAPMAGELYEACGRVIPEVESDYKRRRLRFTHAILESQELAELFVLAVNGLQGDLPTTAVLRRRLQLLIARFA